MSALPLWQRLGFSTRNQYRNAQARKTVNPDTGKPFTSYRQQRDQRARAASKPRDYQAERARRDTLAQTRGYRSAGAERGAKQALARWGISYDEFNAMRVANRKHWSMINSGPALPKYFPVEYHRYAEPWGRKSYARVVAYIVTYYHAIVDPKHNWDSVRDSSGRWETVERMTPAGMALVPQSDPWWYRYLVEEGELVDSFYYDARYGKEGK